MPSDEFGEIRATFQKLLGENHRTMQRKALKGVGDLITNAAKRRAPARAGEYARGGELKPGELAASIKPHVHVPTDEQALAGKPSGMVVAPSGKIYGIAVAIENGHANKRGKKGGKQSSHGNTPAHPFMRPAADETRDQAEALYEASLVDDIQKAMA